MTNDNFDEWYYLSGDETIGPVSSGEIGNALRADQLDADAMVWRDGMNDWMPLRSVSELGLLQRRLPPLPRASATDTDIPVSSVPLINQPLALWNPTAAVNWSLLFSPAFGAFLHARNADALGRTDEARANRVWFYVTITYLAFNLMSVFIPAVPEKLFRLVSIGLLIGWYFSLGKKQIKYVKDTWPYSYNRKPWKKPLSIAFGSMIGSILFLIPAYSFSFGTVIEFGNDEIYYAADATEEDARKLASVLQEIDFFGSGGASVRLESSSARYSVSFILVEDAWEDPETTDAFREIGRFLAASGFPTPLTIHLCDEYFAPQDTLIIQ